MAEEKEQCIEKEKKKKWPGDAYRLFFLSYPGKQLIDWSSEATGHQDTQEY